MFYLCCIVALCRNSMPFRMTTSNPYRLVENGSVGEETMFTFDFLATGNFICNQIQNVLLIYINGTT